MRANARTEPMCSGKPIFFPVPGFHEFLYSIIESFKKIREIAEFIPNQLRFHEKNFS